MIRRGRSAPAACLVPSERGAERVARSPLREGRAGKREGTRSKTAKAETRETLEFHDTSLGEKNARSSKKTARILGPLHTTLVEANDPRLRTAITSLLRSIASQLASRRRIDPALLPLPRYTAKEAFLGTAGCDVLACFAHPDDESGYAAGTLHRLSREGHDVRLVVATRGDGGTSCLGDDSEPLSTSRCRELERALGVIGIRVADQLGFPDFGMFRDEANTIRVTSGDTLRTWGCDKLLERLVRSIRTHRPSSVLTFDPLHDPDFALHGHHLALGVGAMIAFHLAADPGAFPEQIAEGLSPWAVRRHQVVVPASVRGSRVERVEIDPGVKLTALRAHASQGASVAAFIRALEEKKPAALEERWHLLQARLSQGPRKGPSPQPKGGNSRPRPARTLV